jgi:signal transduction histidine kinase
VGIKLDRRLIAAAGALTNGLPAALVAVDPLAPRKRWWAPVSLVAAGVAVAIVAPAYNVEGRLPVLVSIALAVLVAMPLVVLATRPSLAWRIAWFGALVAALTVDVFPPDQPWPWHPVQLFVYSAALWRAATRTTRAATAWLWLFSVALVVAFVDWGSVGIVALVQSGLVLLADQVRRRREVQRGLAEEEARSELEHARRALLEERTRIARELHDVVAHSMSLVAVRAETAPYRLAGVPGPAAEEFTGIATAARDALTEMRRLLGVLRAEDPDVAFEPQPGLADLDGLFATAREAGVRVSVTIDGDVMQVPASVQLSAYRIVQEALSNASRHAPGAPVQVAVRCAEDAVDVVVRNGSGGRRPRPAGAGLGLTGMRERAGILGGTLAAGPAEGGGFEVVAHLPVDGHARQPADVGPAARR